MSDTRRAGERRWPQVNGQLRATENPAFSGNSPAPTDHNVVHRLGCSTCTAVHVVVEPVVLHPDAQNFQFVGSTLLLFVMFDGKGPMMCSSPLHLIQPLAGHISQNLPEKPPQNPLVSSCNKQ